MKVIQISELQMKDIINVSDGKRLGNIGDIEIDMNTGKIDSIIISKQARIFGVFWERRRNCNSLERNCENWGRCHTC